MELTYIIEGIVDMSLLEINNLVGGYTRIPVLKGISFDIQPNELVGLIGLNGAGKSTTIKHIIGLMEAEKRFNYNEWENVCRESR